MRPEEILLEKGLTPNNAIISAMDAYADQYRLRKRYVDKSFVEVVEAVMINNGAAPDYMKGKKRDRNRYTYPRFASIYCLRRFKKLGWTQMKYIFLKDHATLIHGYNTAENLLDKKFGVKEFREKYEPIINYIKRHRDEELHKNIS